MKLAFCVLLSFLLEMSPIFAAEPAPPWDFTSELWGGNTITNSNRTQIDPKDQAMINTWHKGALTNGMYCAIQLVRQDGSPGAGRVCYVYVVNPTKETLSGCLYLPREVSLQMSLADSQGKLISKTVAGNQFTNWTAQQMETSLSNRLRDWTRVRAPYLTVWSFSYQQIVGDVRVGELFQINEPGDYTLHLRLQLVRNEWYASGGTQLKITWFPEVVAKVQILPEDIPNGGTSQNSQTNEPPR